MSGLTRHYDGRFYLAILVELNQDGITLKMKTEYRICHICFGFFDAESNKFGASPK